MSDKKNTIGRFEILEKIGEGPIGAVYKALDPVIRRTVAIKVIKLYTLEETATFAEVFEKIYRVVRTSTALNHPNICIIYDLSEEKKIPFITMEFVDGHDLEWLLQNKHQFKRAEVLNILQQTCDALDFAHRKNVIHQDLKSTNIILTSELHVKITDFGIAGLDEIAAAQTKKLLSIPYYISPEQALGDKVTPASDLFSLGIIMYQILSGQLPFPGTSAANVIMMIARDNAATPKDLEKSGIKKDDWENFFSIALSKAPGQRFRSAKEMFDALSAILPTGETRYFPYSFQGEAISPDKFEKTFVNETPTVMIDPSQFAKESVAEPAPAASEPVDATMVPQPASAFDLLEEVAPAAPTSEPAEATKLVSKEQLQPAAPPTVMMKIPKESLQPPPPAPPEPPAPPPFVSTTAPTQMISMQDFSKSDLPMEPESEPSGPVHIDEISLPEAELPDMATMMVQREPLRPSPPAAPTPPTPPPAPEPMVTMRPTPPEPEPIVLSEQTPPEEEVGMTMRPAAPAPPEPVEKKPKKEKETGKFRAPAPPPPSEPVTPVPAPPPPVAAAPYTTRPVAAAPQARPGGGSLKLLGILAGVIALLILIAGGIFFVLPKITKKQAVTPQPVPTPIKVEPRPEPQKPVEPPPPPAPTTGKIIVTSDPAGATVLVDDQEKGVTPLDVADLPFGTHTVKLTLKGYQDIQQDVQISKDLTDVTVPTVTMQKAAPQFGTLVIESEPTGAFIIINNRAVGTTPKTFANQKPGKINITLKKDGFRDHSETVRVSGGKSATLRANLEEIPKPVVEPPKPVKPAEPEVRPGELVPLTPDVTPPKSIKKAFAKYPEAARSQRLQGVVGLNILVSETGQVIDVKITKSANPILDQAAMDAVKQWQYQPATKKGVPVKVWLPVSMSFQAGR